MDISGNDVILNQFQLLRSTLTSDLFKLAFLSISSVPTIATPASWFLGAQNPSFARSIKPPVRMHSRKELQADVNMMHAPTRKGDKGTIYRKRRASATPPKRQHHVCSGFMHVQQLLPELKCQQAASPDMDRQPGNTTNKKTRVCFSSKWLTVADMRHACSVALWITGHVALGRRIQLLLSKLLVSAPQ